MGALQARSRHRSCADRRGAGHQPEAVGDRAAPDRRVHGRPGRARGRRARCSRSATRSSRSSRSRARSRRSSQQMQAPLRERARDGRDAFRGREVPILVPLGAARAARRSTTVFSRPQAHRRPDRGAGRDRARGGARQRAGPRRAVADDRAGREARDRRLGRAVRRDAGDEPARAARAPDRAHRQDAGSTQRDRSATATSATRRGPGDILVLVRQRGALFEAVISALKHAGIEVAGADRLMLTEHIAVMDLMALADALLLPDDDLALASVLKSPLFGADRGAALRARLGPQGHAARGAARARPTTWSSWTRTRGSSAMPTWARHHSPFAFYARILGADKGRARFYARLGPEAADALDEFLEHALIYERARGADAAGLRRVAARRRHAGEARHGHRARRGARDDRAWRQGPRSADRDPRRHDDAAEGPARAAAAAAAGRERGARHAGPASCGRDARPTTSRRSRRRARARSARPRTSTAGCSMWR